MILELNPAKWGKKTAKAVTPAASLVPSFTGNTVPVPTSLGIGGTSAISTSTSAKAVEKPMSTTTTPVGTASSQPSGFIRFIDAIGNFFKKSAPVIEEVAAAAEPFLALTPFGPEYDLVVNAIIGAQQTATASLATGATLTGAQKMALVLEAVTPGLTTILASKKVTSGIPAAISQFAQNVYNLQTGPTTTVAPVAAAKTS